MHRCCPGCNGSMEYKTDYKYCAGEYILIGFVECMECGLSSKELLLEDVDEDNYIIQVNTEEEVWKLWDSGEI